MSWIAVGAASAGAILGGTGALGNKGGWGDAFKGALIGGSLGKAGAAGFGGAGGTTGASTFGGYGGGPLSQIGGSLLGKLGGGSSGPGIGGGIGNILGGGNAPKPKPIQTDKPSYFIGDPQQQNSNNEALIAALLAPQAPFRRIG